MTDQPEPGVIGSLPRSRPHRRSSKRPAPATAATPEAAAPATSAKPRAATAKPRAATAKPRAAGARKPKPVPAKPGATATPNPQAAPAPAPTAQRPPSPGPLETAVQAAAELAEIGLHAGARALRRAVSRLPRP
ncbi:MAG TPA: hypothetical protein VHX62_14690 [Solirubrobacteraceae bacterium]|nr:hypothetical protein [Solirubrobacteraceae bacterium]